MRVEREGERLGGGATPAEATPWLNERVEATDDAEGLEALSISAARWTRYDPAAASTWLDGLPSGPRRDAGIAGLVREVAETDPEGAFEWAGAIGEPAKRVRALGKALAAWEEVDPAAAASAFEGLDPKIQATVPWVPISQRGPI